MSTSIPGKSFDLPTHPSGPLPEPKTLYITQWHLVNHGGVICEHMQKQTAGGWLVTACHADIAYDVITGPNPSGHYLSTLWRVC
jgi:hypothetical protein